MTILVVCATLMVGEVETPEPSIDCRTLSTPELAAALEPRIASAPSRRLQDQDRILVELVRRGGVAEIEALSSLVERSECEAHSIAEVMRAASYAELGGFRRHFESEKRLQAWRENALAVIAALRRCQRLPDPLAVEVKQAVVRGNTLELPKVRVGLRNVDVGQRPLNIKSKGDYRSGRLARCRLEVRNSAGVEMPLRRWSALRGGGVEQRTDLKYGDSIEVSVDLARFVRLEEPGRYRVSVLYHDSETIADFPNVDHAVCFRSQPFTLEVEEAPKQNIAVAKGSRERALKLVEALPTSGVLRMAPLQDLKYLTTFPPKGSPDRELMLMGWQAVPTLYELATSDATGSWRRAWCFSLLWAITDVDCLCPLGRHYGFHEFSPPLPGPLLPRTDYRTTHSWSWSSGPPIVPDAQSQRVASRRLREYVERFWHFVDEK